MIRLLPKLRSFALRLCRNPEQADDLVQTTCERAIRSLDQFDPSTRLDSWMFRILQNFLPEFPARCREPGKAVRRRHAGFRGKLRRRQGSRQQFGAAEGTGLYRAP
ncbi:sigma factor [Roseibium salinum]|nr:sigma factor [Roseibium salinum]